MRLFCACLIHQCHFRQSGNNIGLTPAADTADFDQYAIGKNIPSSEYAVGVFVNCWRSSQARSRSFEESGSQMRKSNVAHIGDMHTTLNPVSPASRLFSESGT